LRNFDKAVVDGWNPLYYGRYVDDILIVDKVEHASSIYKKAQNDDFTTDDIIEFFLKQCSRWNGIADSEQCAKYSLFSVDETETKEEQKSQKAKGLTDREVNKIQILRANTLYNPVKKEEKSKIVIQDTKVNLFYFKSGESTALCGKVITIFVINESFSRTKVFVDKIAKTIENIKYSSDERTAKKMRLSLLGVLLSSIYRAFALTWKPHAQNTLDEIIANIEKNSTLSSYYLKYTTIKPQELRYNYVATRMIDKSLVPVIVDILPLKRDVISSGNVNLSKFYEVLPFIAENYNRNDVYKFFPYLINSYDLSTALCMTELLYPNESVPFNDLAWLCKFQNYLYLAMNYQTLDDKRKNEMSDSIKVKRIEKSGDFLVSVGNTKKNKLKVAIANVRLDEKNFEKLIIDKPNRSCERYNAVSSLVNQAITEKADILVMPEAFVPFEWLNLLARKCAQNQFSIITGVEHIKLKDKVYNLTAVILPYLEEESRQCAYVSFHLKNHYAPEESEEIKGHRLQEIKGSHYELYKWNDCYFPVYCCYELAAITDRSLFLSYADMLVAVEWNKDVLFSIIVMLWGIITLARLTQFLKAPFLILVIPLGIITSIRFAHPSKAPSLISVTLSGIIILVMPSIPLKTSLLITFTVLGIITSVAAPLYSSRTPALISKSDTPAP
jgi:hypothetical protein